MTSISEIVKAAEKAAQAKKPTDIWLRRETFNGILSISNSVFQGNEGTIVVTTEDHRFTVKFQGILFLPKPDSDGERFSYVHLIAVDDIYRETHARAEKKACEIL